jgi:hypothetical protein
MATAYNSPKLLDVSGGVNSLNVSLGAVVPISIGTGAGEGVFTFPTLTPPPGFQFFDFGASGTYATHLTIATGGSYQIDAKIDCQLSVNTSGAAGPFKITLMPFVYVGDAVVPNNTITGFMDGGTLTISDAPNFRTLKSTSIIFNPIVATTNDTFTITLDKQFAMALSVSTPFMRVGVIAFMPHYLYGGGTIINNSSTGITLVGLTVDAKLAISLLGSEAVQFLNPPAVTISGTPNVAVTNTPAVTVSGTANVAVTNSPTVAVSGTVPISSSVPISVRVNF